MPWDDTCQKLPSGQVRTFEQFVFWFGATMPYNNINFPLVSHIGILLEEAISEAGANRIKQNTTDLDIDTKETGRKWLTI